MPNVDEYFEICRRYLGLAENAEEESRIGK